jgi:diguanylate cyclase
LFNRRGFDDELKAAVEAARTKGRPLSIMMMDVDHFKKFNDTYGHLAGDEVLRAVARVLRQQLADKEIVCRYGGEEFAVLFPGSDAHCAQLGAERARRAIGEAIVSFEGRDLRVTASAGLAQWTPDESLAALIQRADTALYASKSAGRDCCHWHHQGQLIPITPRPTARAGPQRDGVADEDSVTAIPGISSCRTFRDDVERRMGEWRRGGPPIAVALLEVDQFDALQADHGDQGRRLVLRATAQFLKATVRDMDHIAHLEDARFALLLPTAGSDDAQRVAQRLRKAVERCSLNIEDEAVKFTISVGVTVVSSGDNSESLLERAERALDDARQSGGNSVCQRGGFAALPLESAGSA